MYYNDIQAAVKIQLKEALAQMGMDIDPVVDSSKDLVHGDYTSNIAMRVFSNSKFKIQKFRNSMELAEKIGQDLRLKIKDLRIKKIEVVKPGFINFWLSKDFLISQLQQVISVKRKIDRTSNSSKKKVMVEFTDPNPFKEFHIGHLYSNAIGEAISRLLQSQGNEVKRACYQGDVGLHVAKAIYGLLQGYGLRLELKELGEKPLDQRIKILGKAYATGARAYDKNETARLAIHDLNKKIYTKSDPEINSLYEKGRAWSLAYFETIYKRLGTKFDYYYFESEVGRIGLELVKKNITNGIFQQSSQAVIFRGDKYGLHTRVFINSQGFPTYEAKELGLNFKKFQDYPADLSFIVTGNEIKEYFMVLLTAMRQIMPEVASKTRHIGHGMVRLSEGKMSSREGTVITGEWLLDEAKSRIKRTYAQINEKTAEMVAVGAVKYALLKSSIGRDIAFDFDESITLEGDSGPYLQYTYARTRSVLAKLKKQEARSKKQEAKLETEEIGLLRTIYRFNEAVDEASENFAPNILCGYLFDLAQRFNLFYQKQRIIGSENEVLRLALAAAAGNILKQGLYVLGIEVPEKM